MTPTFKSTKRAQRDLDTIYVYGKQRWGKRQAVEYQQMLLACTLSLCEVPNPGTPLPDGIRVHPTYWLAAGAHVIVYRFMRGPAAGQPVRLPLVIRVLHHTQALRRHL